MATLLGPDTNLPNLSGWQVEACPPNADATHPRTVRLQVTSRTRSKLTGAGQQALLAVFNTYLSTGTKPADIIIRHGAGGDTGMEITRSHAWLSILPEDGPALIASICAVFQTAANIT